MKRFRVHHGCWRGEPLVLAVIANLQEQLVVLTVLSCKCACSSSDNLFFVVF
jgi:hypothetical protein